MSLGYCSGERMIKVNVMRESRILRALSRLDGGAPVSVQSVASKRLGGRWEFLNGLEWIVHSGGYENPIEHHAWRIVRRAAGLP